MIWLTLPLVNLRSGRQEELRVPVEIQTSDDANFLIDLLARQKASISRQIDTSLSEAEYEGLIEDLNPKQSPVKS